MARTRYYTRYRIITVDYQLTIQSGFTDWNIAHDWMLNHDWGQYDDHGGLVVQRYTDKEVA